MPNVGDALLYALSALGRWSWRGFKTAFDDVRAGKGVVPENERLNVIARWRCAQLLDALGHCDFYFSPAGGHLVSSSSVLAILPVAGLPRAILCGSRSPQTFLALSSATRAGNARVAAKGQNGISFYAPTQIEVEAEDVSTLREMADTMGLALALTPPAWSLANSAGGVDAYLNRLDWIDGPEIGWEREDFALERLRFESPGGNRDRLSRYRDPIRGIWVYRLVRDGKSALVDSSWGRWIALMWGSRTVLRYEPTTGVLACPAGIPFPRLLARALVLCSGRPPGFASKGLDDAVWAAGSVTYFQTFDGVPADIYELISSKIGQR